jgi:excisionase family DNA binding protein
MNNLQIESRAGILAATQELSSSQEAGAALPRKKPVRNVEMPPEQRLLIDRRRAAQYLSISQRSLDYLVANGELNIRRIGARVLIPISELQRYARVDHKRLVG